MTALPAGVSNRRSSRGPFGSTKPSLRRTSLVERLEARHDPRDAVADDVVVVLERLPGDLVAVAERRRREPAHDRHLGEQSGGDRWDRAVARVHGAHAVLDDTNCGCPCCRSISVRPRVGRISASSPVTTWERLSFVETCTVSFAPRIAASATAVSEMAPTKLPPIAKNTSISPSRRPVHRLQGVGAVLPRHREAELALEGGEEPLGHPLPDAHRAVALHVAVPADGRRARARLADVAAQEQQVDDLLDGRDGLPLLGQAHGPGDDDPVGGEVLGREVVDLLLGESGRGEHRRLVEVGEMGAERVEADRVLGEEVMVEHRARRGILGLEHAPRHGLQQRHVAAGADLEEAVGDLGAPAEDAPHLLRVLVADEPGLGQHVHRDDSAAVALRLLEGAQHAGVVGAGILAHHDDEVGLREVVVGHRGLADADGRVERGAGRLVAHVRAVGQVVGAERAHEELVQERRLVRGAAARVERGAVGRVEGVQALGDEAERVVPGDRLVVVGAGTLDHGLREPTLLAEPVLAPVEQRGERVLRPERARAR